MAEYTSDQVIEMATNVRDCAWPADVKEYMVLIEPMLRAYAGTLRQQGEQAGGVVSDEIRDSVAKIIADRIGNGMREKYHPQADAIIEAVAPLLRAPAERGGRVDSGLVSELLAEADRQANETADLLNRAAEALAQSAQGEDEAPFGYVSRNVAPFRNVTPQWQFTHHLVESHGCIEAMPVYLHAERARVPDGWKLAMFILQSGLYSKLPEEERAVCDALVQENPYIAAAPSHPEDAA